MSGEGGETDGVAQCGTSAATSTRASARRSALRRLCGNRAAFQTVRAVRMYQRVNSSLTCPGGGGAWQGATTAVLSPSFVLTHKSYKIRLWGRPNTSARTNASRKILGGSLPRPLPWTSHQSNDAPFIHLPLVEAPSSRLDSLYHP